MTDLTVDIITAEKTLLEGAQVSSVTAPGVAGSFEVLPGHTTLLSELEPGPVTIEGPEGTQHFAVSGGFTEVMKDHVRILADQATASQDIDAAAIDKALGQLEQQDAQIDPYSDEAGDILRQRRFLEVQSELVGQSRA